MLSQIPLHTNGHALLPKRTNAVHVFAEPGEEPLVAGVHFTCAICDERPVYVLRDGAVHVQEPCRYPRGITTEVTLDVPSGKLIVTADLSDVYDADIHAGASYNTALGQAQAVEAMADLGCAYGPVGNSCPSLYRNGEDGYIIASPILDDDDLPSLPDENRMADICTDDLWAYSIADFEDWQAKGGTPGQKRLGHYTVVDVPPGTYRFTHHVGERGFDKYAPDTVTFAHIARVTSAHAA